MNGLLTGKSVFSILATVGTVAFASLALAQGPPPPPSPAPPPLPPVPVPPGNPITPAKAVLGKILFMDEQLSSDNTTACVTCHQVNRSGVDSRRARNPGLDGIFGNGDDAIASPGVIKSDALADYVRDTVFGLAPQVTPRTSMPMINAAYSPSMFWDGRARGTFIDPETGTVALNNGGAFESQAVGPPDSDVEMAHADRDWAQITSKIAHSKPLALATNLPSDTALAIAANPTYPMLFQAAFGDGRVTARRIAFAIATYERTLISNQSPFDRFSAGIPGALTAQQQAGWNAFNASNCVSCHTGPNLTGNGFRNIGLRPFAEDTGQFAVTNNPADRGKFKVPNLRNVGLRGSFMHNGQFTTLNEVLGFYARAPGAAPQFIAGNNQDPLMANVNVPPQAVAPMLEFLNNALLDTRVRDGLAPFDSVTLASARPGTRPVTLGSGTAGSGAIVPVVIANMPSHIGSREFRIGIDRARGGAIASLVRSSTPPTFDSVLGDAVVVATVTLAGAGAGNGYGTAHLPIPSDGSLDGTGVYYQWVVADVAGAGGFAFSAPVRVTYFCGASGCGSSCPADIASGGGQAPGDGIVDGGDFIAFINGFSAGSAIADISSGGGLPGPDGTLDGDDFIDFINAFASGC